MSSDAPSDTDSTTLSFEGAVEELETIISRIESGDLELEESMTLHRRGQVLLKACRNRLKTAEQELKTIGLDGLDPDESLNDEAD